MSGNFDDTSGGSETMAKRPTYDLGESLRHRIVQHLVASRGPAYALAIVRGYLASEDIAPGAATIFGGAVRELEAMDVEPSGVHVLEQVALSSDDGSGVSPNEQFPLPELPEEVLASIVEAGLRLLDSAKYTLPNPRPLARLHSGLTEPSPWRLRPVLPRWCGAVVAAAISLLFLNGARLGGRFEPMSERRATLVPESTIQGTEHDNFVARIGASPNISNAPSNTIDAEHPVDGAFELQVASFRSQAEAEAYVIELRARGHDAHREQARVPKRGVFHRVRIGPFAALADALAYKEDFERREGMATLVVDRRTTPVATFGAAEE